MHYAQISPLLSHLCKWHCFRSLVVQMQLCKPMFCCHVLFRKKVLSSNNKPYLFILFLIVLSWTLTFSMLTKTCRVWNVALGFFAVYLSFARLNWVEFAWTSTPGKNAPDQQTDKNFLRCFAGAQTGWWSVNQVHVISSTWLLLNLWLCGSTKVVPSFLQDLVWLICQFQGCQIWTWIFLSKNYFQAGASKKQNA